MTRPTVRQSKRQMVGRSIMGSWMRAAKESDPPRVQVACQKCGQPSEQLFAAGPGLICAGCKQEKEQQAER